MKNYETLRGLLIEQLQDVFDAETQLVEALPRMAATARAEELRSAFEDQHNESSEQLARLREIFGRLDVKSERKTSRVMTALIRETEDLVEATGDPRVIDAALIAAAQRIKHYKIEAYGCVKAFAICEEENSIAELLSESSDEAGDADKLLTKIAKGSLFRKSVNKEASKA